MRSVFSFVVCASVVASLVSGCSSDVKGTGQPLTDGGTSSDGVTGLPSDGENGAKSEGGTKKPPVDPTKTCGEAALCASDCPDDETSDACIEDCVTGLSDAEIAKMEQVAICLEESGCGDDDTCIEQACGAEIRTCIGE